MARHATSGDRRGVARWVIAAVAAGIAVVVVVVGIIVLARRSTPVAAGCSGRTQLSVLTSPALAAAITQAADRFGAGHPTARSTCVDTFVQAADSQAAQAALAGGWTGRSAPGPALWIADSDTAVNTLEQTDPALTAGRTRQPLATSPVVLAVRPSDAAALAGIDWRTLATAGAAVHPGSGPWQLAWPEAAGNVATRLAAQSVVASGAADGRVGTAAVAGARSALASLTAAGAGNDLDADAAVAELAADQAPFTAVPALEIQVAQARGKVSAVYPQGRTVSADVDVVPVTATWVDAAQTDAATQFSAFLSGAGRQVLADAGLRIPGTTAASARPGTNSAAPASTAAEMAPSVSADLLAALGTSTSAAGSGTAASSSPLPPTSAPSATSPPPATTPTRTATPASSPPPSTPTSTAPPPVSATGTGGTTSATGTGTTRATGAGTGPVRTPGTSGTGTTATATATATTAPVAAGPVTTFVLDASANMAEQVKGRSRADWAAAAIEQYNGSHPQAQVAVWTVNDRNGATAPQIPVGPLSAAISGAPRSQVIRTTLENLSPQGACPYYGALLTTYQAAAAAPVTGTKNRIVVITASTDTTPNLPRSELVAALTAAHNPAVELDVISLSADVNDATVTAAAAAGGGRFAKIGVADLAATVESLAGS